MVRFAVVYWCVTLILIGLKLFALPSVIRWLFPANDTGAAILEMFILASGGVAACLLLVFGSFAKQRLTFNRRRHFLAYFMLYAPVIPYYIGFTYSWYERLAYEWIGLLSEPLRLMTMKASYSDGIAFFIGLILFFIGRKVEIYEKRSEKRRMRQGM